jgi:dihydrofolate reductase
MIETMAPLAMIVAMGKGRVIGFNGDMPWHFSEDLKHFKRITMGHSVIMGRKTFDSIGRALPRRQNIVVTRQQDVSFKGCEVAHSLGSAIDLARSAGDSMPMIIGGATIYSQAMSMATVMHITEIDIEAAGDTFFPDWEESDWSETDCRSGEDPMLTFRRFERRQ